MKYLRTISGRLTLLFVIIISLVLCAFGAFSHFQASQKKQIQIDKELNGVASRLEISLPSLLWNLDQNQLQKVLISESNSELVSAIVIADEAGKITGGLVRTDDGKMVPATAMPILNGPSRKIDLKFNNSGTLTPVGSATILVSTMQLDEALKKNLVWLIVQILALDAIIVVALYLGISAVVITPLTQIKLALQDIAEGDADLTKRLTESRGDEFSEVGHWFNVFIARLQQIFQQISSNSAALNRAAEETLAISDRASSSVEKQNQITEQLAAAVRRLTAHVAAVTQNASVGSDASGAADQEAKKSRAVLAESIRSTQELAEQVATVSLVVQRLAEDTEKIDGILDVIVGIAGQTNLLALNAAIEAARAGEQGRGFAVVADEVRKLAERTTQSTHEIQEMVLRIKDGNGKAVEAMNEGKEKSEISVRYANQAQTVIDGILDSITRISDLNSQILVAANSQTEAVEGISGSVNQALHLSEETVEVSHNTSAAGKKLDSLARQMKSLAEEFKT